VECGDGYDGRVVRELGADMARERSLKIGKTNAAARKRISECGKRKKQTNLELAASASLRVASKRFGPVYDLIA